MSKPRHTPIYDGISAWPQAITVMIILLCSSTEPFIQGSKGTLQALGHPQYSRQKQQINIAMLILKMRQLKHLAI